MKSSTRHIHSPRFAFFSIALAAISFSSCAINPELNSSKQGQLGQTTCAESTKTFNSAGAAEAGLYISQLPAGLYTHVSSEVYFESSVVLTPGTTPRAYRVQFLETPTSNPTVFTTSLRCRESQNGFTSITVSPISVFSDFTRFNSTNRGYDTSANMYAMNLQTELKPTVTVSDGGDMRNTTSSAIANSLSSYWTAGYQFVRRTGDTYEFIGTRDEGDRLIKGKATFTRTNLPANSQ